MIATGANAAEIETSRCAGNIVFPVFCEGKQQCCSDSNCTYCMGAGGIGSGEGEDDDTERCKNGTYYDEDSDACLTCPRPGTSDGDDFGPGLAYGIYVCYIRDGTPFTGDHGTGHYASEYDGQCGYQPE